MEAIMLGKYGGVPGIDDACSSFVIETENGNILVDCGSGVVGKLQIYTDLKDLKAIILSHLHFDHFNDLFVLYYAYKLGVARGELKKIPVFIPKTPEKTVDFIVNSMSDAFDFTFYNDLQGIEICGVNITFLRTKHGVETYAMKFAEDNISIGYTADTGYFDELAMFMKNCNVLISEAGMLKSLPRNESHMTPTEAYRLADAANIGLLTLTHFWYQIKLKDTMEEIYAATVNGKNNVRVIYARNGLKLINISSEK